MNRTGVIFFLLIGFVALSNGFAQEAMIVDPSGNVGINTNTPTEKLDVNGNVNVSGDIVSSGEVQGQNLAFNEVVVITDTYPTQGSDKNINLPPQFTADNTFIISAKVRNSSGDWSILNVPHATDYGLRIFLIHTDQIYMQNRWTTNTYDNQPVVIILGRIDGLTF